MKISVLTYRDSSWPSLREIIPALERAWRLCGARYSHQVDFVATRKDSGWEIARRVLSADAVGVLFATPAISRVMHGLRRAGVRVPAVIHTHGEGTAGAARFGPLAGAFTRQDSFLCASRAEAACLRACFPGARVRVAPFPMGEKPRALRLALEASNRAFADEPPPLFYIGRISEQKNLHSLLFSLRLLQERRPELPWRLEVYGAPDRCGNPNMGFRFNDYPGYLQGLSERLGLAENILWRGWRSASAVEDVAARKRHVLVSPSLHSDEDFGVSAFKSLLFGRRAVLSDWGGHRDFKTSFPGQVSAVRAYRSSTGPFIAAGELAGALGAAMTQAPGSNKAKPRPEYGARAYASALRDCLRELDSRSPRALHPSQAAERVLSRMERLQGTPNGRIFARMPPEFYPPRVFEGYADAAAGPFFRRYGARQDYPANLVNRAQDFVLAPWAKILRNKILIRDPRRGAFSIPRSAKPGRAADVRTVEGEIERLGADEAARLIENGWLCRT
ncbi:MAG TPA: glycosyltransferase [Elusimicrobiota bacterium]|nr:glycosyltransferase [Elusimicrobiota bacterium]